MVYMNLFQDFFVNFINYRRICIKITFQNFLFNNFIDKIVQNMKHYSSSKLRKCLKDKKCIK